MEEENAIAIKRYSQIKWIYKFTRYIVSFKISILILVMKLLKTIK